MRKVALLLVLLSIGMVGFLHAQELSTKYCNDLENFASPVMTELGGKLRVFMVNKNTVGFKLNMSKVRKTNGGVFVYNKDDPMMDYLFLKLSTTINNYHVENKPEWIPESIEFYIVDSTGYEFTLGRAEYDISSRTPTH